MINWIAAHAWAEIWALAWHFGTIGFILFAALAWAWFVPIFKKTALWVALGAAIIMVTAVIYTRLGADYVQAKCNADAAATVAITDAARKSADAQFPSLADGVAIRVLPNDPWDRDQAKPGAGAAQRVRSAADVFKLKGHRPNDTGHPQSKSNVR